MAEAGNDQPFVVFKARSGRMMLHELWSAVVSILIVITILIVLQQFRWEWLIGVVVMTVIVVAISGTLKRRSRRIVIGDSWVEGPTGGSPGSTTVQFDVMDRERSGFKGGRLRILAISGRGIEATTMWYSPEDIEEIKRLLRDRFEDADGL